MSTNLIFFVVRLVSSVLAGEGGRSEEVWAWHVVGGVVGGLGHRVGGRKVIKVRHGVRGGVLGVVRIGRGVIEAGGRGWGHVTGLDLHLDQGGRASGVWSWTWGQGVNTIRGRYRAPELWHTGDRGGVARPRGGGVTMRAAGRYGGRGVAGGRQGGAQPGVGAVCRGRDPWQRGPGLSLDGHRGGSEGVPGTAGARALLQLGRGLSLCLRVSHYRLPLRWLLPDLGSSVFEPDLKEYEHQIIAILLLFGLSPGPVTLASLFWAPLLPAWRCQDIESSGTSSPGYPAAVGWRWFSHGAVSFLHL